MKKLLFIIIAAVTLMSCEKAQTQEESNINASQKTEMLSHTYELVEGWQSISFYLEGESDDIANILAPIADKVIQCKSLTGTYAPAYNLNTIGEIDYSDGFKIKVTEACTFTVTGTLTTDQVILNEGWNQKGVPGGEAIPIEQLFPIGYSSTEFVKEAITGALYYPNGGINDIGNAEPGKAYLIHID